MHYQMSRKRDIVKPLWRKFYDSNTFMALLVASLAVIAYALMLKYSGGL